MTRSAPRLARSLSLHGGQQPVEKVKKSLQYQGESGISLTALTASARPSFSKDEVRSRSPWDEKIRILARANSSSGSLRCGCQQPGYHIHAGKEENLQCSHNLVGANLVRHQLS